MTTKIYETSRFTVEYKPKKSIISGRLDLLRGIYTEEVINDILSSEVEPGQTVTLVDHNIRVTRLGDTPCQ